MAANHSGEQKSSTNIWSHLKKKRCLVSWVTEQPKLRPDLAGREAAARECVAEKGPKTKTARTKNARQDNEKFVFERNDERWEGNGSIPDLSVVYLH